MIKVEDATEFFEGDVDCVCVFPLERAYGKIVQIAAMASSYNSRTLTDKMFHFEPYIEPSFREHLDRLGFTLFGEMLFLGQEIMKIYIRGDVPDAFREKFTGSEFTPSSMSYAVNPTNATP